MDALNRRAALALAGLAGVSAAACSSPAAPSAPSVAPTSSATPTPVDSRPRWPLTGKLLKNDKDAQHTAVAVKVPDNQGEHPQSGINDADLVFVEYEGYLDSKGYSSTRLMPVFHSKFAADVAPVRSIRPLDVPLLSPITAVIGSTGGAGWVKNYLGKFSKYIVSDKTYIATKGTGAYSINAARIRTLGGVRYYDRAVVCHPKILGNVAKAFTDGPQALYFPFATGDQEPSTTSGKTAKKVAVPWKGSDYKMTYTYDEKTGRYLRSMPWGPHVLADGSRVNTDNVLVIKAKKRSGKLASGAGGNEILQDLIDSTGEFVYAHGGQYVTGTWTKGAVEEPFQFTLADGSPLVMALGRSFIEVPDAGTKVSIS